MHPFRDAHAAKRIKAELNRANFYDGLFEVRQVRRGLGGRRQLRRHVDASTRGVVEVRDFIRNKTVFVHAGQTYLAKAPTPSGHSTEPALTTAGLGAVVATLTLVAGASGLKGLS